MHKWLLSNSYAITPQVRLNAIYVKYINRGCDEYLICFGFVRKQHNSSRFWICVCDEGKLISGSAHQDGCLQGLHAFPEDRLLCGHTWELSCLRHFRSRGRWTCDVSEDISSSFMISLNMWTSIRRSMPIPWPDYLTPKCLQSRQDCDLTVWLRRALQLMT